MRVKDENGHVIEINRKTLRSHKKEIREYLKKAHISWGQFRGMVKDKTQDNGLRNAVINEHKSAYCAATLHDKCKGKFVGSSRKCECNCHKTGDTQ